MLEQLKFLQEHQQLLEDEETIKLQVLIDKLQKESDIKEGYVNDKKIEEEEFYKQFNIKYDTSTNN